MTNRIFLDSSIFIEPLKGNKVVFYESLVSDMTKQLFIDDVVLSEYLYYILMFSSDVSPKTLQRKNKIKETLEQVPRVILAINNFIFLPGNQRFLTAVPAFMSKYNLLPNDAIILATCKLHKTALASHDSDFINPCEEENIELIRDI